MDQLAPLFALRVDALQVVVDVAVRLGGAGCLAERREFESLLAAEQIERGGPLQCVRIAQQHHFPR